MPRVQCSAVAGLALTGANHVFNGGRVGLAMWPHPCSPGPPVHTYMHACMCWLAAGGRRVLSMCMHAHACRSTARVSTGQRVALNDVENAAAETRDGEPYYVYEHLSQVGGPRRVGAWRGRPGSGAGRAGAGAPSQGALTSLQRECTHAGHAAQAVSRSGLVARPVWSTSTARQLVACAVAQKLPHLRSIGAQRATCRCGGCTRRGSCAPVLWVGGW